MSLPGAGHVPTGRRRAPTADRRRRRVGGWILFGAGQLDGRGRRSTALGASTAVIMYCAAGAGEVPTRVSPEAKATARLLASLFPSGRLEPAGQLSLGDASLSLSDTVAYGGCFPGVDIVCAGALADFDRTAEIPRRFLAPGDGRRTQLLRMLSSVDYLSFGVWSDGRPVRALTLDPDNGIVENLGTPLPCEAPFWAGERPVDDDPDEFDGDSEDGDSEGDDSEGDSTEGYPFPFHPLELGEVVLRALFGFVLEGMPHDDDIDPYEVPLVGFRVR